MEYLTRLTKKDLRAIIEMIMGKMEDDSEELYEDYKEFIDKFVYCIDLEDAQEIVSDMQPLGEVYNYSSVVDTLKQNNMYDSNNEKCVIDYYLVMNMIRNDYKHVIEKYNVSNINQFTYDMSKCFIDDEDGTDYKVSKYFLMLTK